MNCMAVADDCVLMHRGTYIGFHSIKMSHIISDLVSLFLAAGTSTEKEQTMSAVSAMVVSPLIWSQRVWG